MRSLKDICEGLLSGQNKILSLGDDIANTDLIALFNAKTEEEFNLMFDILKVNVHGEKRPDTHMVKTASGDKEKRLKTKGNNLYIGFRIRELCTLPSRRQVIIGNKDVVEICWSRAHDEVRTYDVEMKYEDICLDYFEDYRYMPEKWKSQALKIILRTR